MQQETAKDGMARLQSQFENFNAEVNRNVNNSIDINPKARIALHLANNKNWLKLCCAAEIS